MPRRPVPNRRGIRGRGLPSAHHARARPLAPLHRGARLGARRTVPSPLPHAAVSSSSSFCLPPATWPAGDTHAFTFGDKQVRIELEPTIDFARHLCHAVSSPHRVAGPVGCAFRLVGKDRSAGIVWRIQECIHSQMLNLLFHTIKRNECWCRRLAGPMEKERCRQPWPKPSSRR
jgi:hypothetical protein